MTAIEENVGDVDVARVVDLLGGGSIFGRSMTTKWQVHEAIREGLPSGWLISFVDVVPAIGRPDVFDKIFGLSLRTLQRRKKDSPSSLLSSEQSGRLYKAAEVVAKARHVLGSTEDVDRFLMEPALALDGKRPIDLLSTPVGAEMVETHLERLDYGVYT